MERKEDYLVSMREYWDGVAAALPQSPRHSRFGLLVSPYWRLERRLAAKLALSYIIPATGDDKLLLLKTDLWNEGIDDTTGDLFYLLEDAKKYTGLIGIDVSPVICHAVRGRISDEELNVACADVRSLPFGDGSFDALLDVSTLDHIPPYNLASVIGEYKRVTKNGGVLALIFDSETFWWVSILRNVFNRLRYHHTGGSEYWWKLSPVRVKYLLVESGFEVLNELPLGIMSMSPFYLKSATGNIARRCIPTNVRDSMRSFKFTKASRYLLPFASQYLFIAQK